MFKSDSEVEELIGHKNNGTPIVSVKVLGQGQDDRSDRRNSGKREILDVDTKAKIGILASIMGVKNTAELVDKTPGMVSRIKNGKNGVGEIDQDLTSALNETKDRIQNSALKKAELFLEMLDIHSDAGDNVKRAIIAEKVVNIYEKLTPKNGNINDNRTQIIFYAPKVKESASYPIIEVEAQNG